MSAPRFAFLDARDFRALEMLESPLYVFSFFTQHIVWANGAALRFWNAESLTELQQRELTPFSRSTELRLKALLDSFRRGEERTESWTYYPKGKALTALAHCRGVSMVGHANAMLVEIRSLDTHALPAPEVRAIEALRHTPVMVSMFGDDGAVLLRNPAAMEFLERLAVADPANAENSNPMRCIFEDPADYDWLEKEARRNGYARLTVRTREASSPYHSMQLTRIADPATGAPATLWVQQDVSQLHDMTTRLAGSETTLDVILGLSEVPSLLASLPDGRLLKFNYSAQRTLGFEADSSHSVRNIFADSTEAGHFLEAVQKQGSCTKTVRLVAHGGRIFWAAVLGTKLPFETDDAALLSISDVDDLHSVASELELALSLERGVSEMQRQVLEIASHEFRTPLAVIDGAAQRIARRASRLRPEELEVLANRIRSFVRNLSNMLDRTIDRAKRDLARVYCDSRPGRVQIAIREICQSFAFKVDIEVDASVDLLPMISFDATLFEAALVKLVENSIKYAHRSPKIRISASVADEQVELLFRDWGIGIPSEDRDRVFEERARGSNVGQRSGSGLGLYLVREIVRAHGGDVHVAETDGPGTTIRLLLPLNLPGAGKCDASDGMTPNLNESRHN